MIDDIRKYEKRLFAQIMAQERAISAIFDDFTRAVAPILRRYREGGGGVWVRNRDIESALNSELRRLENNLSRYLNAQTAKAWNLSHDKTDLIVKDYIKGLAISEAARDGLFFRNMDALKAFQNRVEKGFSVSSRIWKTTQEMKSQMELYLQSGLATGRSAAQISRDVRGFLQNPDKRFRRVRDPETGKLKASKPMQNYHPGTGKYRSAYKNALRLTRTETNMAYRYSDQVRWRQTDFITGYEVKLSAAHDIYDICDSMIGQYPKNFTFYGWHPNCYDQETEVLTANRGWQFFKDVKTGEQILSLNTETRDIETATCTNKQEYDQNGVMVHFHNRSLDLMVTPDHRMVYISKSSGNILSNKTAREYNKGKGGLYRSSEWVGVNAESINIGKHRIEIDLFAEFMGYWLADGSYSRRFAFSIAQRKDHDPENNERIRLLLEKMPFEYRLREYGFEMFDKDIYLYLEQFGRSHEKHIPPEIKQADKNTIQVFLDAFISCDGHIRKNKEFIGNRGNKFTPKNDERTYFTSSKQMASDIGELILKVGRRPSYSISDQRGPHKFKNGTYNINHILHRINECYSQTATVFEKEYVPYSGKVYDLTIDRNHTLYVRRNGKCVWSSNCYCYSVPVMLPQDKFVDYINSGKMPAGEKIKGIPPKAFNYVKDRSGKLASMDNKPYWLQDNFTKKNGTYFPKKVIDSPPTIKGAVSKNK
jgi:hypothetical protein